MKESLPRLIRDPKLIIHPEVLYNLLSSLVSTGTSLYFSRLEISAKDFNEWLLELNEWFLFQLKISKDNLDYEDNS